jgi:four helix bundle protein
VENFRELRAWEKAHELTLSVYKATAKFPKEEFHGLTSQIRRASAAIASNIAEGCGRGSDADFAYFLQIAMGSVSETEYQLLLSRDLGFMVEDEYSTLQNSLQDVKQTISSQIQTLHMGSPKPKQSTKPAQAELTAES